MKKLFLILMSVLCVSHQAFTIYNPFQVLLLMPGRAAAVIAYAGKKAGLVSDETSRPTIWLHEEDSLRYTWFYEESIANIYRKSSSLSMQKQKKSSSVKSDLLSGDLKIKFDKIASLQDQLESFSKNIGHDNHQPNEKKSFLHFNLEAIHATLDIASKNIIELYGLQNTNILHELVSELPQDQDFQSWFNSLENNANLLAKVREERDVTLADVSSFIIDDRTLQSLENKITRLIQAPKLDFSTHISLAKQHHKKVARQYFSAVGTYTVDLCACKNAEDYITIGAGGLGLLGFMSLMSKNNSEISKVAYVGCGGATSLIAKKLYNQFLCEHEENIGLDAIKTNLNLTQSRLDDLKRYMHYIIFCMHSDLKNEYLHMIMKHEIDKANDGISHLQSVVTNGFEKNEAWQQQESSKTEHLQHEVGDVRANVEKTNTLLSSLSLKLEVSEEQLRAWIASEGTARDQFEANILHKLSSSDQIQLQLLQNSREQLNLLRQSASHKTIQNSLDNKSPISTIITKIDAK